MLYNFAVVNKPEFMSMKNLLQAPQGCALVVFAVIYLFINGYLLYRFFIQKERRLYLKKIMIVFISFFILVLQELVFYSSSSFEGVAYGYNLSLLNLKLFICTSFFIIIIFQSIGFLEDGIKLCLQYIIALCSVIFILDTMCYISDKRSLYYAIVLLLLLIAIGTSLIYKFIKVCMLRYDAIVHTLKKDNLYSAFMIFIVVMLASYMIFISLLVRNCIAVEIITLAVVLLLHLVVVNREIGGYKVKRTYNIVKEDDYPGGVLMDERITDDYKIIQRLILYFESDKPYLDSELKMADVSKHIYTNKTYLSRALNRRMSRNFNQFVNYYRVREACAMYIDDPLIKITDLCDKSGFKNVSSFSNAFNLNVRYTPAEWCKEVRRKLQNNENVSIKDYFI